MHVEEFIGLKILLSLCLSIQVTFRLFECLEVRLNYFDYIIGQK